MHTHRSKFFLCICVYIVFLNLKMHVNFTWVYYILVKEQIRMFERGQICALSERLFILVHSKNSVEGSEDISYRNVASEVDKHLLANCDFLCF
jgi:hypothetical protein